MECSMLSVAHLHLSSQSESEYKMVKCSSAKVALLWYTTMTSAGVFELENTRRRSQCSLACEIMQLKSVDVLYKISFRKCSRISAQLRLHGGAPFDAVTAQGIYNELYRNNFVTLTQSIRAERDYRSIQPHNLPR
jgi:hypothetical protein